MEQLTRSAESDTERQQATPEALHSLRFSAKHFRKQHHPAKCWAVILITAQ